VSGFDDVPVLSPVLGEGNMTGERSGTENMENIGRVEGVGDDREREEMSGTMINHAIGSRWEYTSSTTFFLSPLFYSLGTFFLSYLLLGLWEALGLTRVGFYFLIRKYP
jgi:hypothetical protein